MNKIWSDKAWADYLYWQTSDKKILKKINELLKDVERNGLTEGTGHPERLKYRQEWSRRINHEHRLVYSIIDGNLYIYSCKGHYED